MYQICDQYYIIGFSFNNDKVLEHGLQYKSISHRSNIVTTKSTKIYALIKNFTYYYSINNYQNCVYLSDSIQDIIFNGSEYCEGNVNDNYSSLNYDIYVFSLDKNLDTYTSYDSIINLKYIDCNDYILFNLNTDFLNKYLDTEEKSKYLNYVSNNSDFIFYQFQQETAFNILSSKQFIYSLNSIKDSNPSLYFSLIKLVNSFHSD